MTKAEELLPVVQEPPLTLHVKFVDVEGNRHIRKWSVDRPFDGASLYVYAGNGSPLQPGDGSEHYPLEQMPMALRFVAEHLRVECGPHVTEDMVRICADAAEIISHRIESQVELVGLLAGILDAWNDIDRPFTPEMPRIAAQIRDVLSRFQPETPNGP